MHYQQPNVSREVYELNSRSPGYKFLVDCSPDQVTSIYLIKMQRSGEFQRYMRHTFIASEGLSLTLSALAARILLKNFATLFCLNQCNLDT